MELSNLRIEKSDSKLVIAARLGIGDDEATLWYSLPARLADYIVTDAYDSFVLAALPLAMRTGERLIVRGPMSEKLFYNLTSNYIKILHLANPQYDEVTIDPDSLEAHIAPSSAIRGAACGFSGGVDSFYTLQRHTQESVSSSYRLKYLIFNNVGGHGQKYFDEAHNIFESRFKQVSPIADELGLEMIKVDSNLNYALRDLPFPETHTVRNASAALLLQPLFSKFLYSSGLPYSEQGFRNPAERFHDYIDSQTVHLLGTERTECILVGAEKGRIEKLEALKDYAPAHRYLNVCINLRAEPGLNCCSCEKCLRTLTILEANGSLEKFGNVFDLQK